MAAPSPVSMTPDGRYSSKELPPENPFAPLESDPPASSSFEFGRTENTVHTPIEPDVSHRDIRVPKPRRRPGMPSATQNDSAFAIFGDHVSTFDPSQLHVGPTRDELQATNRHLQAELVKRTSHLQDCESSLVNREQLHRTALESLVALQSDNDKKVELIGQLRTWLDSLIEATGWRGEIGADIPTMLDGIQKRTELYYRTAQEKGRLEQGKDELDKENEELARENDELERRLHESEDHLELANQTREQEAASISNIFEDKLRDLAEAKDHEMAKLEGQHQETEQKVQEMEQQLRETEQKLRETEQKVQEIEQKVQETEQKLQSTIQTHDLDSAHKDRRLEETAKEIEEYQVSEKALDQHCLSSLNELHDQAQTIIARHEKEYRLELEDKERQMGAYRLREAFQEERIAALERQHQESRQNLHLEQQESAVGREKLEDREKVILQQYESLDIKKQELLELKRKYQEVESKRKETNSTIEAYDKELRDQAKELSGSTKANNVLQDEVQNLRKSIKSHEEETAQVHKLLKQKELEGNSDTRIKRLKSEHEKILGDMQRNFDTQRAQEMDHVDKEYAGLLLAKTGLDEDISHLLQTNSAYRARNEELEEEIAGYKKGSLGKSDRMVQTEESELAVKAGAPNLPTSALQDDGSVLDVNKEAGPDLQASHIALSICGPFPVFEMKPSDSLNLPNFGNQDTAIHPGSSALGLHSSTSPRRTGFDLVSLPKVRGSDSDGSTQTDFPALSVRQPFTIVDIKPQSRLDSDGSTQTNFPALSVRQPVTIVDIKPELGGKHKDFRGPDQAMIVGPKALDKAVQAGLSVPRTSTVVQNRKAPWANPFFWMLILIVAVALLPFVGHDGKLTEEDRKTWLSAEDFRKRATVVPVRRESGTSANLPAWLWNEELLNSSGYYD
ncbi:MAG: hypothetical protein Q9220_000298 [cf. Caloplaca sp. 1 TL-2023]